MRDRERPWTRATLPWMPALVLVAVLPVRAQDPPRPETAAAPQAIADDPRSTLEPGLDDAGQAARNLELVASLGKPRGFIDPEAPAGLATAPEPPPKKEEAKAEGSAPPAARPPVSILEFANTDLAFRGEHLFVGSYHGFNTYGIEDPGRPRLVSSVVCPGGQGDVSVRGNLLFMSAEETRGRIDCGTQGVADKVSAERFRGVRIFDISDLTHPKQVAAVQTCRGSHTHTLVTSPATPDRLYVYSSGTGPVRPGDELEGCSDKGPKDDPNTALFSIDVIEVPLEAPDQARIVNRPRIFADPATGAVSGLWQGGDHGPGTQTTSLTDQCHDITAFPELGLAAGACAGNGILMDISDPVKPVRIDQVVDEHFAYWHSATFNNDGTKVVFTDEWGGGLRPRCRPSDPPAWGANAVFDIVDRKLKFAAYYKLPAPQGDQENCVAHNGSIIPVPGRDIMAQGWYQGGVSVFDFSDSAHPVEIAYFDRGPLDAATLYTGGYWSAYWYNGSIYGSEIARGLDVFRLTPSEHLSQNEIDAAMAVRLGEWNTQQQRRFVWPPSSLVARAYLDQLTRSNAVASERVAEVNEALGRADTLRTGREKDAAAILEGLEALASRLVTDAEGAAAQDAARLRLLAANLRERAARFRRE